MIEYYWLDSPVFQWVVGEEEFCNVPLIINMPYVEIGPHSLFCIHPHAMNLKNSLKDRIKTSAMYIPDVYLEEIFGWWLFPNQIFNASPKVPSRI